MKVTRLNENFDVIEPIVEEVDTTTDRFVTAIADYRKFANLDESVQLTEDMIDEWALNEAACKHNLTRTALCSKLLEANGNDEVETLAKKLDAEVEVAADEHIITTELNASLKRALWMQKRNITSNFPNKLFVSLPGAGKTAIIYQWAKTNNINIVYKDCKTMDISSLGGILTKSTKVDDPYAGRMGTREFHVLDQPRTVLFLDELNRAPQNIQGALLTLINEHYVWDPNYPGERHYLPNFLFTVAAINPPTLSDPSLKPLGGAMRNRFKSVQTPANPRATLKYVTKYYNDLLVDEDDPEMKLELQGKLAIAEKILTHKDFVYDTVIDLDDNLDDDSYQALSPRSFMDALESSDGTKKGFLDQWSGFCNYKKKPTIERILMDFVDVKDKANDALKTETQSTVFNRAKSHREKLRELGLNV